MSVRIYPDAANRNYAAKNVNHSKEQRTEKQGAAWLPEQQQEDTIFKTIIHQFRSVLMLWFAVQAYRRPAAASPLRFAIASSCR